MTNGDLFLVNVEKKQPNHMYNRRIQQMNAKHVYH